METINRGGGGGASLNSDGASSDDRSGGVPVDGFLGLVQSLIGCGATPDVAVTSATAIFTAYQDQSPAGTDVSAVSSRKVRNTKRWQSWRASVSGLPYQDGQCYLHPVRFGRRHAYLKQLGANPKFSDFVAFLRDGDLDMQVAKDMSFYRISDASVGGNAIVYHIASVCMEGERLSSVYDAIAGFLRLYPWVNKDYVITGPGVESIPIVGTVGKLSGAVIDSAPVADTVLPAVDELPVRIEEPLLEEQVQSFLDTGDAQCDVVWIADEPGGRSRYRGGTCVAVPENLAIRLPNGVVIGRCDAPTIVILPVGLSYVSFDPDSLVVRPVDVSNYHRLHLLVCAGFDDKVVVRAVSTQSVGVGFVRVLPLGNGTSTMVVDESFVVRRTAGIGYMDRLSICSEHGEVYASSVLLPAGVSALCLPVAGELAVDMSAAGSSVKMVGVWDLDGVT